MVPAPMILILRYETEKLEKQLKWWINYQNSWLACLLLKICSRNTWNTEGVDKLSLSFIPISNTKFIAWIWKHNNIANWSFDFLCFVTQEVTRSNLSGRETEATSAHWKHQTFSVQLWPAVWSTVLVVVRAQFSCVVRDCYWHFRSVPCTTLYLSMKWFR